MIPPNQHLTQLIMYNFSQVSSPSGSFPGRSPPAPDAWAIQLGSIGEFGEFREFYSCMNSFRRIHAARRTNASLAGTSSDSKKLSILSFFHPISSYYNIVIPANPVKTLPAFFYFGGNLPFLREVNDRAPGATQPLAKKTAQNGNNT